MILTVIGARPQFIKAAVVSQAFQQQGIEEVIIHTGQHFDDNMSKVFWDEMNIPKPAFNLNAGAGSQTEQTARMMLSLEKHIIELKPAAVLVYGDTNSTIAAALVAAKLNIPLIHVEAGLRSFNRTMPEEINRIVTDHLSTMLFCSSREGMDQLSKEGIEKNVFVTGDVMLDALKKFSATAKKNININELLPFKNEPFILATIHRPVNTDNPENFRAILDAFGKIPMKIVWPVHPRNRANMTNFAIPANVYLIAPASYFEMQVLLDACEKVCTDSGGLQKEAYWSKKICITLREETEWTECLHDNWNMLTGAETAKIIAAAKTVVDDATWYPLYGEGDAAEQIAKKIGELIS